MPSIHCIPRIAANPMKAREICGIRMSDCNSVLNIVATAAKPSAPAIHSE